MHVQQQSMQVALDSEIVRRARVLTSNSDTTIEQLLAGFIEAEEAKALSDRMEIKQWVDWSNALIEQHGSPADEHNPFL